MRILCLLLFLASISSPLRAEYFEDGILLKLKIELDDGSEISGWTNAFYFSDGLSQTEFERKVKTKQLTLSELFSRYMYNRKIRINTSAVEYDFGWIFPNDTYLLIDTTDIVAFSIENTGTNPVGCSTVSSIKNSDLPLLRGFKTQKLIQINTCDYISIHVNDSSILNKIEIKMILEQIPCQSCDDCLSDVIYKNDELLLNHGIIVTRCYGL